MGGAVFRVSVAAASAVSSQLLGMAMRLWLRVSALQQQGGPAVPYRCKTTALFVQPSMPQRCCSVSAIYLYIAGFLGVFGQGQLVIDNGLATCKTLATNCRLWGLVSRRRLSRPTSIRGGTAAPCLQLGARIFACCRRAPASLRFSVPTAARQTRADNLSAGLGAVAARRGPWTM